MASLIGFDKNRKNVEFKGYSKLSLNFLSNYLFVEPVNEDFKMISASFKWNYIMKKNLLFVFAEHDFLDFCLIFNNDKICYKIFTSISSVKNDAVPENLSIDISFIIPIFQKIQENPNFCSDLIAAFKEWHNFLDKNDKEKYSKLMKKFDIFDMIFPVNYLPDEQMDSENSNQSRKRRYANMNHSISSFNNGLQKKKIYSKYVSSFQVQLWYSPGMFPRKLIVYTTTECSTFHEYKGYFNSDIFQCVSCGPCKTAIIDINDEGEIYAKLTNEQHACEPSTMIPRTFTKTEIIQKQNYKIFENGSGHSEKDLVIFDTLDKKYCYEYYWDKSNLFFRCRGCAGKKIQSSNKSKAIIYNEGSSNEYVEMMRDHLCQKRHFKPDKFQKCFDYVLKPYFEIQKFCRDGIEGQSLIIFDSNDKSQCYVYGKFYWKSPVCFYCRECSKRGKRVTAKLRKNRDDEEYVILINTDHVCTMQKYISKNSITLASPEFEYIEKTKNGFPKVIVFAKENKGKCYVFGQLGRIKSKFYCLGCKYAPKFKKNEENDSTVYGVLSKDKNDIFSFKVKDQKHVCQPRPYQPEQYACVSQTSDYFFYRQKNCRRSLNLAIYHPNDKKLCFTFVFDQNQNNFTCKKCNRMKKFVTAKRQVDKDGTEFYVHLISKHICQPVKVSSIKGPDVTILPKNDKFIQQKLKQNSKTIDESKVIRLPNFELCPNTKGEADKRVLVFHPTNPQLCWQFDFFNSQQRFTCIKCTHLNRHISGKLEKDKNGDVIFILNSTDHLCEPLNYEKCEKFIYAPKFKLFYQNIEHYSTKLVIFISPESDACYIYQFIGGYFYCLECKNLKQITTAKLLKSEGSNKECIKLLKNNHVCEPQKFDLEKFPTIHTADQSLFEICDSKYGQKNARLLLFTTEKKELFYGYRMSRKNYFTCSKNICHSHARLCQNSKGVQYLELTGKKHVCKPEKYIPKKAEPVIPKKNLPESMFELHENMNGEENRSLTVFADEKKELIYRYFWLKKKFACRQCFKMKTTVSAEILEDKSGKKYLELSSTQHICSPQVRPVVEDIQIIPETMYELCKNSIGEDDKKLIIFTDEKKDHAYIFTKNCAKFYCSKCGYLKKKVCAKFKKDKEGKTILETDKFSFHICFPSNYPETKIIIPESMFQLSKNPNNDADKKLLLYSSEQKDKVYEYHCYNHTIFYCTKCRNLKQKISAYLRQDDNGKNYLELNSMEHACSPTNVIQPPLIIVPESMFILAKNTKGEDNKKLILFANEKKNSVFNYCLSSKTFACAKCAKKNKRVTAKLKQDESGLNFLVLNTMEHLCIPEPYNIYKK